MKNITVLGSTGSIGVSALDVIARNPEMFNVVGLAAGKNVRLLQKQIEKFQPHIVSVSDTESAADLRRHLSKKIKTKIVSEQEGAIEVASLQNTDVVISAISGAAGLIPTLTAIDAGKDIALANKETMVMAGSIVKKRAKEKKVRILPVDSEHSAVFQCLQGQKKKNIHRIILTASGGPFLNYSKNKLKNVTLEQALQHPNWKMGMKITVDSASMMNKGLEVIEARWLFDFDIHKIDVLIHPQSVIHSLIELIDGSVLAQLGIPDMRTPIAYALTYPDRINNHLPELDLTKTRNLEFYSPDVSKFPCLKIAYEAGICGGTMPSVLNAANEITVEAFLQEKIKFIDFAKIIDKVITMHAPVKNPSLEEILDTDAWARAKTKELIERIKS